MNRSADLLIRLKDAGATISLDGEKLVLKAPKNSIQPSLRLEVLAQKEELVAVLQATLRQEAVRSASRQSATLPLSSAQRRIWFLTRLDPASKVWNINSFVKIDGPLSVPALQSTFDQLVARHRILRTSIQVIEGSPRMQFKEAQRGVLEVLDCADPEDAKRRAQAVASFAFNLEEGGLFRALLLSVDETHHYLLIAAHHVVLDGWSLGIISREVAASYTALAHQQVAALDEAVDFEAYVQWEQEQEDQTFEQNLVWWERKLEGPLPILELPADRPRGGTASSKGQRISLLVPLATTERLKALASVHQVTTFVLLLTVFKVLLCRYTGLTDILVGTVSSYRRRREFQEVIGMFANPIVLRTAFPADVAFSDLLTSVRETVLEAFAHDSLPFDRLVEHLHPEREGKHNPIFQVAFAYQNLPLSPIALEGLEVCPQDLDFSASRYDLSVEIWRTISGLQLDFEYDTSLFDRSTIQRMQHHYIRLLDAVLEDSTRSIHTLDLLTEAEKHQLTVEWNGKRIDYPVESIHRLVEKRCAEMPE